MKWLAAIIFLTSVATADTVRLAGSFNDWNPTNAAYVMKSVGEGAYEFTTFFRAGKYKFKFVVDGAWDKAFGGGAGGRLVQPGSDIPLVIPKHGAYWIRLETTEHKWELDEV